MGTIAEKLLYLDETKTALKQAINAMGGSLDDNSPFRRYEDEIWRPLFTESLFAAGEQGLWYDPSDISTLFQDANGTVPVTESGQPVGLILDKRLNLVRGPNLVMNGGLDSTANWITTGVTISSGKADLFGQFHTLEQTIAVENGKYYEIEFEVLAFTGGAQPFALSSAGFGAVSDIFTPVIGFNKRIVLCRDSTKNLRFIQPYTGTTISVDNITVKELPGNHAYQNNAAAKPIYRNVGGRQYLEFDGVQDFLITNDIGFTGTTNLFASVALEKKRNAGREMILELSSTVATPGTFNMDHGQNAAGTYAATLTADAPGGARIDPTPAPGRNVLTAAFDSAQPDTLTKIQIYLDGVEQSTQLLGNPDAGSGDIHRHPLYIGSRFGTELFFQGDIYSIVVRAGVTSAKQLERVHRYAGSKSGVTIL